MDFIGIDTHCHPQFPEFDTDRDNVVGRARSAGIGMICVGTDAKNSREAVSLANGFGGMWASVGQHPNEASGPSYDEAAYESLLGEKKVIAVGEIGLDFHRIDMGGRAKQEAIFLKQLDMAERHELPCIIHCRDAHDHMLEILRQRRQREQDTHAITHAAHVAPGVIHSFNEAPSLALSYISLGWYIGLNGIITFNRGYDGLVKEIPLDHILLETDSPYLSPVPHRGIRNEPVRILNIASHIAALRNLEVSKVLETTTRNAYMCFSRML